MVYSLGIGLRLLTSKFSEVLRRGWNVHIWPPHPGISYHLNHHEYTALLKLPYFTAGSVAYSLEKDNICQIFVILHRANYENFKSAVYYG